MSGTSGTIILIDGPAGCGKTTIACGLPAARAMLETDPDGSRWLREHFAKLETERTLDGARKRLMLWGDDASLASICVDVWAYFWQLVAQQVQEGGGNTFRAWGAAKMSVRRLYDPLIRAKRNGKHVLLTAHTKDAYVVSEDGGKQQISKSGEKADCEAMLNDLLDVHLRMGVDFKKGTRWLETIKCRPQRNWKPLLPARLDVPANESHLMYGRILDAIGVSPASAASVDAEVEDQAAQQSMQQAAQAARR